METSGDYASVEAVRDTVVRAASGRIVRVRDVAEVTEGDGEVIHITRVQGQRGVIIVANQREGQNILTVRAAIASVVSEFERTLPPGVTEFTSTGPAAEMPTRRIFSSEASCG